MFQAMLLAQVDTRLRSRNWPRRSQPLAQAACAVSNAVSYETPRDTRKRTVIGNPRWYALPYSSAVTSMPFVAFREFRPVLFIAGNLPCLHLYRAVLGPSF